MKQNECKKSNNPTKKYLIIIFLFILFYSFIILINSDLSWPISDEASYAKMAVNESVIAPFKHRIIVPLIVSLFPEIYHKWVFLSITVVSFSLTTIFLYKYLKSFGFRDNTCLLGTFLFLGSRLYQYHLYLFGLVDPTFFLFVILYLYFNRKKKIILSNVTLFTAFYVKEAIIFYIPITLLQAVFNRDKRLLISNGIISLILFSLYFLRDGAKTILQDIISLTFFEHNGVYFNQGIPAFLEFFNLVGSHLLNIYSVLSIPALIGFIKIRKKDKLLLIVFCLIVLGTFFIATNWGRMIFLLFPFIYRIGLIPINEYLESTSSYKENLLLYVVGGLVLVLGPIRWLLNLEYFMLVYFIFSLLITVNYVLSMKKKTHLSIKTIITKNLTF